MVLAKLQYWPVCPPVAVIVLESGGKDKLKLAFSLFDRLWTPKIVHTSIESKP